MQHIQSE
jgi:protein TIF31